MAKEDKEQFFVGIHETRSVRRNVLEGSREMVHVLQSYDKVKAIREEKQRRTNQFKTVLEELKLLVSKLNQAMPKVQVRTPKPKVVKVAKRKSVKADPGLLIVAYPQPPDGNVI